MEVQKELIGQAAWGTAQAFVHAQRFNKHCANALSNYINILRATGRQN